MAELLCKWLQSEHGIATRAEQLDEVNHSIPLSTAPRASLHLIPTFSVCTGFLVGRAICTAVGQLWAGQNPRSEAEQHKLAGAASQLHSAAGLVVKKPNHRMLLSTAICGAILHARHKVLTANMPVQPHFQQLGITIGPRVANSLINGEKGEASKLLYRLYSAIRAAARSHRATLQNRIKCAIRPLFEHRIHACCITSHQIPTVPSLNVVTPLAASRPRKLQIAIQHLSAPFRALPSSFSV